MKLKSAGVSIVRISPVPVFTATTPSSRSAPWTSRTSVSRRIVTFSAASTRAAR